MTGWEIRQALRVILSHPDTTIEAGLAWLDPGDAERLLQLLSALNDRSVSRSDKGAAAELGVCADLVRRGFQVFRAVSPGASDFRYKRTDWRQPRPADIGLPHPANR